MKPLTMIGLFTVGALAGVALSRHLMERSSCCERVADAARDRIVAAAGGGPAARALGWVLDVSGVTSLVPGLLDKAEGRS